MLLVLLLLTLNQQIFAEEIPFPFKVIYSLPQSHKTVKITLLKIDGANNFQITYQEHSRGKTETLEGKYSKLIVDRLLMDFDLTGKNPVAKWKSDQDCFLDEHWRLLWAQNRKLICKDRNQLTILKSFFTTVSLLLKK